MKKFRLVAIAIALTLVTGCASVSGPGTSAFNITESIRNLKEHGCSKLDPLERKLLVAALKTQIGDYPAGGICDPLWIDKELLKQLEKLEATTSTTPWLKMNPSIDLAPNPVEREYAT